MELGRKDTDTKIMAIEGLRGLAAMAIACVYHLATVPFPYSSGLPFASIRIFDWIYRRGALFVELFLVISGYISFVVYTARIDRGMTFPQYAAKRAVRIYPLMIATLLLAAAGNLLYVFQHDQTWWLGGWEQNSLTTFIFSALGLQLFYPIKQSWNYPAWSLSIFFVCWIVYFAIIRFTKGKRTARILACCAMVLLGVGLQINRLPSEIALFNRAVARAYVAFFSGGIVYYVHDATENKKGKSVAVSAVILLSLVGLRELGVPVGNHSIVFGMVIFPLILLMAMHSRVLGTALSLPPLPYLGRISFSIYLCNYSIEVFTVLVNEWFHMNINFSGPGFFFGNMIVHVLVGSLFYQLFEKGLPAILKKKYSI